MNLDIWISIESTQPLTPPQPYTNCLLRYPLNNHIKKIVSRQELLTPSRNGSAQRHLNQLQHILRTEAQRAHPSLSLTRNDLTLRMGIVLSSEYFAAPHHQKNSWVFYEHASTLPRKKSYRPVSPDELETLLLESAEDAYKLQRR